MPTYQYVCTECGGELEALQKFTDDPLTVHDACGGRLRKVFSPVGIVFKGSGFYRTDSRKSAAVSDSPGSSSSSEKSGVGASDGKASSGSSGSASSSDSSSSSGSSGSSGDGKSAASSSSAGSAGAKVA